MTLANRNTSMCCLFRKKVSDTPYINDGTMLNLIASYIIHYLNAKKASVYNGTQKS